MLLRSQILTWHWRAAVQKLLLSDTKTTRQQNLREYLPLLLLLLLAVLLAAVAFRMGQPRGALLALGGFARSHGAAVWLQATDDVRMVYTSTSDAGNSNQRNHDDLSSIADPLPPPSATHLPAPVPSATPFPPLPPPLIPGSRVRSPAHLAQLWRRWRCLSARGKWVLPPVPRLLPWSRKQSHRSEWECDDRWINTPGHVAFRDADVIAAKVIAAKRGVIFARIGEGGRGRGRIVADRGARTDAEGRARRKGEDSRKRKGRGKRRLKEAGSRAEAAGGAAAEGAATERAGATAAEAAGGAAGDVKGTGGGFESQWNVRPAAKYQWEVEGALRNQFRMVSPRAELGLLSGSAFEISSVADETSTIHSAAAGAAAAAAAATAAAAAAAAAAGAAGAAGAGAAAEAAGAPEAVTAPEADVSAAAAVESEVSEIPAVAGAIPQSSSQLPAPVRPSEAPPALPEVTGVPARDLCSEPPPLPPSQPRLEVPSTL
ncbi:unnamed protein product [Closterium sp. NIES-53]